MKRNIAILVVCGLILILLGWLVTGETEADISGAAVNEKSVSRGKEKPPADNTGSTVKVLRSEGDVRVRTGDSDWRAATPGQFLGVDDEVESGLRSKVTLQVGDASTVELMPDARVAVRELSSTVQRMGLLSGRVSVNYEEKGQRVLQIENEDGTAVARVREGKFSMMNNGTVVAVATETGSVDLSSAGSTVVVKAGNQSVASSGATPSRPGLIPVQAILKLSESACRKQQNSAVRVRGAVEPGTRVFVNSVPAKVNHQGQFVADVTLPSGKTRIVIETEDVIGRRVTRNVSCVVVDPDAEPVREIDFKWGVSKGKKAS